VSELLRRHLDPRAILVGARVASSDEAIDLLAARLEALGRVHPSWGPAARRREATMPTGLPLGALNAAIPHTDPEHVREAAVALAILGEPVAFRSMEDPDERVDVRVVFALAVREKGAQIPMLQAVIGTLADAERLARLAAARDADEALAALDT
jgi:galactitol PTS system EIIA component